MSRRRRRRRRRPRGEESSREEERRRSRERSWHWCVVSYSFFVKVFAAVVKHSFHRPWNNCLRFFQKRKKKEKIFANTKGKKK